MDAVESGPMYRWAARGRAPGHYGMEGMVVLYYKQAGLTAPKTAVWEACMPQNLLFSLIPALFLILSLYSLLMEALTIRLHRAGAPALAEVLSVDYTVAFGQRYFLGVSAKKPEREKAFPCDYIVKLRFSPEGGEPITVQTTVPARMRVCAGERMPYLSEGNEVPIRYLPRNPKRLVVALEQVEKRQKQPFKAILWGISTLLSAAILVAMIVLK